MKDREKVTLHGTTLELLTLMAEGNPGGLTVMLEILKTDPHQGLMRILDLDDMNIRGSQIWVGFKDHCGQDLAKFIECLKDRSQEMVDTINAQPGMIDECGEAVTSGASSEKADAGGIF